MTADTNYYQIALEEYQRENPSTRRAADLLCDPQAREKILARAQELKTQVQLLKFHAPKQ